MGPPKQALRAMTGYPSRATVMSATRSAISWIATIATEVVSLLKTIGVILNISDSLLGLTIFALVPAVEGHIQATKPDTKEDIQHGTAEAGTQSHDRTTEVVSLLKTIGVILNISDSLLGLTIFAVGNSLGDLVADQVGRGKAAIAVGGCRCEVGIRREGAGGKGLHWDVRSFPTNPNLTPTPSHRNGGLSSPYLAFLSPYPGKKPSRERKGRHCGGRV
jgi:hypothetical protein